MATKSPHSNNSAPKQTFNPDGTRKYLNTRPAGGQPFPLKKGKEYLAESYKDVIAVKKEKGATSSAEKKKAKSNRAVGSDSRMKDEERVIKQETASISRQGAIIRHGRSLRYLEFGDDNSPYRRSSQDTYSASTSNSAEMQTTNSPHSSILSSSSQGPYGMQQPAPAMEPFLRYLSETPLKRLETFQKPSEPPESPDEATPVEAIKGSRLDAGQERDIGCSCHHHAYICQPGHLVQAQWSRKGLAVLHNLHN